MFFFLNTINSFGIVRRYLHSPLSQTFGLVWKTTFNFEFNHQLKKLLWEKSFVFLQNQKQFTNWTWKCTHLQLGILQLTTSTSINFDSLLALMIILLEFSTIYLNAFSGSWWPSYIKNENLNTETATSIEKIMCTVREKKAIWLAGCSQYQQCKWCYQFPEVRIWDQFLCRVS